jgi:hypothetical protein
MHYDAAKNNGNRTQRMSYHVLTSKSKITSDFFDWMKKEHKTIAEEIGENPAIVDLKIIGL